MNDDWKTSVDLQLGRLHSDYVSLRTLGYSAVAFVLIVITSAYLLLNSGIVAVQVEQGKSTTKLENVDQRLSGMDKRLDDIDQKMDRIVERLGAKAK